MFCTQCGNEVEQRARFCSKCGHEVTATAPSPVQPAAWPVPRPPAKQHDMGMHINILGWLLVGIGILTGIGSLVVLFAGQVIRHLPIMPPDMPVGMPHFVGWLTGVIGLFLAAMAAGVAAAGVGLIQYRDWARTLAVIMAVFLIFHFPIGTAIAIYAFWVLFSREGQEYYKARSTQGA